MKPAITALYLTAALSGFANPEPVEDSLRRLPPGSTDLVPRAVSTSETEVEYGPLVEVVGDWKPAMLPEIKEELKELFIPAERIQVSLISINKYNED